MDSAPLTGVMSFVLTDIEGSTALWDTEAESMVAVLDLHDGVVEGAITEHGGMLLKSKGEGDSTLSVFSRTYDAVTAAIALQHRLTATEWPAGLPVRVRVAVHSGEVHFRDGDYFGATLSRAARIRSMARGGEVVISDSLRVIVSDRLPPTLRLIDGGRHQLRGFSTSERVWWLTSADADPVGAIEARLASVDGSGQLPLPSIFNRGDDAAPPGREHELAKLHELWQEVVATDLPRVAFVAGEPGIGKTQLAAAFATAVHASGANVLLGRCDETGGVALQPFAEALSAWIAAAPDHELQAHVDSFGLELARLSPALTQRVAGTSVLTHGLDSAQAFLFDAVAGAFRSIARDRPLLVVIDDLHWSDRATIALLRHLLRESTRLPLLLLCSYRDTDVHRSHPLADTLADLRTSGGALRVRLSGLDVEAVQRLVDARLPSASAYGAALHEQTGGNPFFIGEVLRHLSESGALADAAAGEDVLDRLSLPEGVREVIGRRLARLPEDCVRVLRVAALIGASVPLRLLEAAARAEGAERDLLDVLDDAVNARVLVETATGFEFAHALIRQTVSSELTAAKRSRLHQRIAETIEAQSGGEDVDALAFHYAQCAAAGQLDKALHYAMRASAAALDRGAWQDAQATMEAALELLDIEQPVDRARRAELLIGLAATHEANLDAICELSLAALDDARAVGRTDLMARAVSVTGGVLGGRVPKLVAAAEEVLRALSPSDDIEWRSMVLHALAYMRAWHMSEGAAVEPLAEEAFELALRTGNQERIAQALQTQFVVLEGTPDLERLAAIAQQIAERAPVGSLRWAEALAISAGEVALRRGDRVAFDAIRSRVRANVNDAVAEYLLRPLDASAALLEGKLDEAFALGIAMMGGIRLDVTAQTHLLVVAGEQGRAGEFLPLLRDMHAESPTIVSVHCGLAAWEAQAGDEQAARAHVAALVADDLGLVARDAAWPTSLALLAEAATRLGERGAAAVLLRHLAAFSGQIISSPARTLHGAADRHIACLRHVCGELDVGDTFERAVTLERNLGGDVLSSRTEYWWGWALQEHEPVLARGHVERAAAGAEQHGMVGLAKECGELLARFTP